jgi:hypothetical protein
VRTKWVVRMAHPTRCAYCAPRRPGMADFLQLPSASIVRNLTFRGRFIVSLLAPYAGYFACCPIQINVPPMMQNIQNHW